MLKLHMLHLWSLNHMKAAESRAQPAAVGYSSLRGMTTLLGSICLGVHAASTKDRDVPSLP